MKPNQNAKRHPKTINKNVEENAVIMHPRIRSKITVRFYLHSQSTHKVAAAPREALSCLLDYEQSSVKPPKNRLLVLSSHLPDRLAAQRSSIMPHPSFLHPT